MRHNFASRGADASERCLILVPRNEGAGNAGCTNAPTATRAKQKRRTQANTGTPKSLRHSLRNGVTAAPCSSWCAGLVSHHRCAISACRPERADIAIAQLDPSVGGTEPHGLTVHADIP